MESSDLKKGLVNAIQDLYDVVHHEAFLVDMRSAVCLCSFYLILRFCALTLSLC